MLRRLDLQALAALRLKEAEVLHSAGLYDGSIYLCGYVVESAMKACFCKVLNVDEYPDSDRSLNNFKTHDFDTLTFLAGLRRELTNSRRVSGALDAHCRLVFGWKPDLRYQIVASESESLANLDAIRSNPEGILTWLSRRW